MQVVYHQRKSKAEVFFWLKMEISGVFLRKIHDYFLFLEVDYFEWIMQYERRKQHSVPLLDVDCIQMSKCSIGSKTFKCNQPQLSVSTNILYTKTTFCGHQCTIDLRQWQEHKKWTLLVLKPVENSRDIDFTPSLI